MLLLHDPRCANYGSSMRPEQPARITRTVPYLQERHPDWRIEPVAAVTDETLLLAHTPAHLKRLTQPRDFDADTPFFAEIDQHARRAVGGALRAADAALHHGERAFSLMRPPGHHATAGEATGFCYLNSIAIAALWARQSGAARVAIWDFDAHHGNGTEAIVRGRPGLLFSSVHQFPGYPGTGTESFDNCRNFPVAPRTPATEHLAVLQRSWEEVVAFGPDLVLVSAGFDAYARDPLTAMTLEREDFRTLGRWLHAAPCPVAAVLEGGYSEDLPALIEGFLEAWQG